MSRKIALIVGYGQSNELGTGTAPRYTGLFSPVDPNNFVRHAPILGNQTVPFLVAGTPGSYTACSPFQKLSEGIASRTGWVVALDNKAVGGTGVVDGWAGWDSGNSRVKRPGEAGYDPNARVSGLVAAVANRVSQGYEVWMITAGHQQDLTAYRGVTDIAQANVDIQNACIAAGASKVFVGKTTRYYGGSTEAEWDAGGKIHLVAAQTIAALGGRGFAGGDLSGNTDLRKLVADGTVGTAPDSQAHIHLNHSGVCWAAKVWYDALVSGGHI